MKKQVVGSMSEWSGMLRDLFRQINYGSVTTLNLQAFLEHRNPFDASVNASVDVPDIDWQRVYEVLGMKTEYENTAKLFGVPADPNLWIVQVVKGITSSKIIAELRNQKVCIDDIEKGVLIVSDRDPNSDGSYAIGFRRTIEADEENRNFSANDLAGKNCQSITLLERLLLEFGYFLTTGQNLDVGSATLCAGSHNTDGEIPHVLYDSTANEVCVDWRPPNTCGDGLRSRKAIILAKKSC